MPCLDEIGFLKEERNIKYETNPIDRSRSLCKDYEVCPLAGGKRKKGPCGGYGEIRTRSSDGGTGSIICKSYRA